MIFNTGSYLFDKGVLYLGDIPFEELIPSFYDKEYQILFTHPNSSKLGDLVHIDPSSFDQGDYTFSCAGYTFAIAEVIPGWNDSSTLSNIEIIVHSLESEWEEFHGSRRISFEIIFQVNGITYFY